jgi:hypothetical protein
LPIQTDEDKKTLVLNWHDIYDLDVYECELVHLLKKVYSLEARITGEWKPIKGTTYTAKIARTRGEAYKQEAVSIAACCRCTVADISKRTSLPTAPSSQEYMEMTVLLRLRMSRDQEVHNGCHFTIKVRP